MHCIIFIRFVKNYLWDISFLILEVCCQLILMHLFTNKHEHLYQCPVIIFQSFANISDLNQWLLQQPIDYKIQNFPEDQDLSPILTDHEGGEITSEWSTALFEFKGWLWTKQENKPISSSRTWSRINWVPNN